MAIYKGSNFVGVNSIKEKKVYVEVPEGSTIEDMSEENTVAITPEQYNNLQEAIEYRTGKEIADESIDGMIAQLNTQYNINLNLDLDINNTSTWTRPNGWPNLDSLNLQFSGNDDFIYMTYRTGHIDDFLAFHIELVSTSNPATIEFGTITNGVFTANSGETESLAHNTNHYYYFNNKAEGYIVVKVTGKIKIFRLIGAASANGTPNSGTYVANQQYLLERIAYVPNIINFFTSGQYWSTYYLEREKIGNNTGNACTSLQAMYYRSFKLENLDISQFYTPKNTSLYDTFNSCYSLKQLNITHWITEKVTNCISTFSNCVRLKSLDLRNWNLSLVTQTASMFNQCRSLIEINGLENFNNSKLSNIYSMFYNCQSLLDITLIKNWDVSRATSGYAIFYGCNSIKELDLSNWDVHSFTRADNLFNGCFSLKIIKFPQISTANLTTIGSIFNNCYSLQNIDLTWLKMDGGTCTSIASAFQNCRSIQELHFPNNWDLSGLNNTNYAYYQLFNNCYSLKTITGITNWDFRSSTNQSASNMFNGCHSLENLDISGWKIHATQYNYFFGSCYNLKRVNISGFDFSNCTTVNAMFYYCQSLEEIICPLTYNTSNITNMASMFSSCNSLKSIPIDFSLWNMNKVTTIADIFANCHSLKSININNWSLPECTTIATMFNYDYALEELSWNNWSIPKVTSTSPGRILADCWSLRKMVGFPPIKLNFSMTNTYSFPVEEFVNLFNNLQTTSTTRTINIMTQNINKLSSAQKAIATSKGWSLAN